MAELLVLPGPAKRLQNGAGFSGKKLEQTGPAERESEWSQCYKVSSWQVRQSRLCVKENEQSRFSRSPDRGVGESQGDRELHLGERKGIRAGAWRGKSGLHGEGRQVPGGEEGPAKRTSLKEW